MLRKLGKIFWGLLILPLTVSTLFRLPAIFFHSSPELESVLLLLAGAVLYILFEALFSRPMRTYVFGHELTHALTSMAMGGKVRSFHVSKKEGSVTLTESNFLVSLAPYCIPIYTFLILLLFFILKFFYPPTLTYKWMLLSVGFTLAFHGSLTLFAIRQEQPDIRKTGSFFSLVFILLANAWTLVLLWKALFWNRFSLRLFLWDTLRTHTAVWKWLWLHAGVTAERCRNLWEHGRTTGVEIP